MENLIINKLECDCDCRQELENKRKRRCSLTQSNESPKKKTFVLSSNDAGDDQPENGQNDTDNEELKSQIFLGELCDEVLYEIFKYLDTWTLMALMNVCRRFEKFVLDKRLWENIDLGEEPLPLGILEDMLERSTEKTKSIKLRGPSPSQHIDGEIRHFNKTIRNSFTNRCINLVTLELYGVTLDFDHIGLKEFPPTLIRLVLNTCNVRVVSNTTLFSGIDTILHNLEEVAIEHNAWFDPYNLMPLSKLPLLRYLSLRGCCQMQEFIPYGSIAARHGFKQLKILDLRDTPLNDSDLQCFNTVQSLKEMYLQCPDDETSEQALSPTKPQNEGINGHLSNCIPDSKIQTTSNELSANTETPSTSMSAAKNADKHEKAGDTLETLTSLSANDREMTSSSSSSSSSPTSPTNIADNNTAAGSTPKSSHPCICLSRNVIPSRSHFLPRPDRILYLDVRHRTSPNSLRHLGLPAQVQQNQQQSPPPVLEQMMRHNLFWDIVNPLSRAVGEGGPDRLFDEHESGNEYHLNLFSLPSNRQQSRGSISDRGVCYFGHTPEPVQQGIIWIRFNNRPSNNCFERFSVRDYKLVTDVSLQHLVQCSPYLIFLDVSGTSVTLEGLRHFKALKPECDVVAEHLLGVTKNETTVS